MDPRDPNYQRWLRAQGSLGAGGGVDPAADLRRQQEEEVAQVINEYRRLERMLQQRTQQLDALLRDNGPAGEFPVDFEGARYRRYGVDFIFVPEFTGAQAAANADVGSNNDDTLLPQEKDVKIDAGTVFRCAGVETFVQGVGTANDPYSAAATTVQVTLPWRQRLQYFDFMWRIRDTGRDQEWTDQPQPSMFLGGGHVGPLWLPRRTGLSGGTNLVVRIEPFRSSTDPGLAFNFFEGGTISQFNVHVSFFGHEVPDGGPL